MSKEFVLLLGAEADIQRAFNYYEDTATGRGDEFLLHVESGLTFLESFPEGSPVFRAPFRRLLIAKYPFGIFYVNDPTRVIVIAVLDLRQNPEAILERLKEYH